MNFDHKNEGLVDLFGNILPTLVIIWTLWQNLDIMYYELSEVFAAGFTRTYLFFYDSMQGKLKCRKQRKLK